MDKHEEPRARGQRMLKESGYHADAAQDRKLVRGMVKPTALKRANGGGMVHGGKSKSRPDKRGRGGHTVVNVIAGQPGGDPEKFQMAAHQGMQKGVQIGAQLGAKAAAAKLGGGAPGMAPPPGAGPGMPPPGGAPMPPGPPMGAKDGGTIKVKAHERRKAGGGLARDDMDCD